jgi:hypothetical protein
MRGLQIEIFCGAASGYRLSVIDLKILRHWFVTSSAETTLQLPNLVSLSI